MVSIRCMIEECRHNAGLYCEAQEVEIASAEPNKHVDKSAKTACKTFACRYRP